MRRALSGWSAKSGTTTMGTPAASPARRVPKPPWHTIAAACGITSACGTQRSTRTFAGRAPSAAGSWWRPIVTSTRTRSAASASIAARQSAGKNGIVGATDPKVR
jgi:hypothetical protein